MGLQQFLLRFEPSGDGFIYRKSPGKGGVLVSAREREQMVATYDDRQGWTTIICVANIMPFMATNYFLSTTPAIGLWEGRALVCTAFLAAPMAAFAWAEAGPRRFVRGRPPVDLRMPEPLRERRRSEELRDRSLVWPLVQNIVGFFSGIGLIMDGGASPILRGVGAVIVLLAILNTRDDVRAKRRSARAAAVQKPEA